MITTGFDRVNLRFCVEHPRDKFAAVTAYLREHEGECGIIYCLTRKVVEEVCEKLIKEGLEVTRYHAGLGDEERSHRFPQTGSDSLNNSHSNLPHILRNNAAYTPVDTRL